MAKTNRDKCIIETLKWEGGYSNAANDAGGPTNWGITIADARKYWKKNASSFDVKAMPKSVAIDIYATKYWKTPFYDCDQLPVGVDLVVFDAGVNSGPSRAARWLKEAQSAKVTDLINKYCDIRLAFLKVAKNRNTGAPLWPTFGKGWSNRIVGIRAKAIQMATSSLGMEIGASTAVIVVGGSAIAAAPVYWPYILGGTIATLVLGYLGYRWYKS